MEKSLEELRKEALAAWSDHQEDVKSNPDYRKAARKHIRCRVHNVEDGICVACGKEF